MEQSKWWSMVKVDLEKAAAAAQKSFMTPGVIIGFEEDDTGNGNKKSYLIRLKSGEVGEYLPHILGKKDLPTGVRIKSDLPEPMNIVIEPDPESFAFEVLREQIKLLPRLWLMRNITSLLNDKEIIEPDAFHRWILLSPERKKDSALINMLETVVNYEGLRGLARFNDYASK